MIGLYTWAAIKTQDSQSSGFHDYWPGRQRSPSSEEQIPMDTASKTERISILYTGFIHMYGKYDAVR